MSIIRKSLAMDTVQTTQDGTSIPMTMTDEEIAEWLEILQDDVAAVSDLFPAAPDEDAATQRKRIRAVLRTLKELLEEPGVQLL